MEPEKPVQKDTVSVFCWRPWFLNSAAFPDLMEPLRQLGINRIYQQLSVAQLEMPETAAMVQNFAREGVETVCLTGDPNWLWDGAEGCLELIKAIDTYNCGLGKDSPIRALAIDAECYTQEKWQQVPEKSFRAHVRQMEKIRQTANRCGIRVIQVIPNYLDKVDSGLLRDFISRCCDEVSVMNYTKKRAVAAIETEATLCAELGVPLETLFETMPVSEKRSVTEEITYYYEGPEALASAAGDMKRAYGASLGVGYHHYDTIHSMLLGTALVSFYPSCEGKIPDVLWLVGSDGSRIPAYAYEPRPGESCFLAVDAAGGVEYSLELVGFTCSEKYELDDNSILDSRNIFFELESGVFAIS